MYERRIAEEGIEMPSWVPSTISAGGGGLTQTKLDGSICVASRWTKEGLLEHIVQFIVLEDQVSRRLLTMRQITNTSH